MFSCMMSSRMFLLQSSPSQFLHVALFLAAEVKLNIFGEHLHAAQSNTPRCCSLLTCYVTDAGV